MSQMVPTTTCAGVRYSALELGTVWAQIRPDLLDHLIRTLYTRTVPPIVGGW